MNQTDNHLPEQDIVKPLLGPDDPPPFEVINPESTVPILLVCDHASRAVPASLSNLGLSRDKFDLHIAYDIGAADVTRRLAHLLNAPAVLAGYSRLVIDCNRAPGDPAMIPTVSDQITVPGNDNLHVGAVVERLRSLFWPYHGKVAETLTRMRRMQHAPTVFSIHSFTPRLDGVERYWDIGVLWNRDPRLSAPLISGLRTHEDLHVGDNEPYSGRDLAYTLDVHGTAAGLANCAVEIRQDNLIDDTSAEHWAELLADALRPILGNGDVNKVERF
jgi:predicted N-formylglutamate amidohydrolase